MPSVADLKRLEALKLRAAALLDRGPSIAPELSARIDVLLFRKFHTRPLWPDAMEAWTEIEETQLRADLATLPPSKAQPVTTTPNEELLEVLRQRMAGFVPRRAGVTIAEPLIDPTAPKEHDGERASSRTKVAKLRDQLPEPANAPRLPPDLPYFECKNDRLADYRGTDDLYAWGWPFD